MSTVIGLFQQDENIHSSIYKLQQAGFAVDKIRVLTRYDEVQKLFSSNESHLVMKYMGWGALLGIAILNLYGLTIGGYACNRLLGYIPVSYWICDIVGFTLLGLILGLSAGFFVGVNKFEGGADLYTHGVSRGGQLMTVKVDNELATDEIINILDQENAQGIKVFQDLVDVNPS
jgi:hypothetical protein